jgi:hypothetical protein
MIDMLVARQVVQVLPLITLFIAGTVTGTGRWKVSAKIQQLLNTLKRPKRRPLPEFYEDDDIELEIAANPKDPNAPKPEGGSMTSAVGEQLVVCIACVRLVWIEI